MSAPGAGALKTLARLPVAVTEFSNILLTTQDAAVGTTPKDVIWTHRKVTLYRYRSDRRTHQRLRHKTPVLLVFALINRPDIFDLAPGASFVEYLLEEGYDVFLLDWGVPDDEDADMGIDTYVCDELHAGVRETLRASGAPQVTLLGWCIGATLSAMYVALSRSGRLPALPLPAPADADPVRNLIVLTMPVDPSGSLYTDWVGGDEIDVDRIAERLPVVPGRAIDWANKTMKPVTNWWATYRKLFSQVLDGSAKREAYQPMAHWVGDNPPFPSRAFKQWVTWMYKENRLVKGTLRLRGERVDLADIDVPLLVVTAGADHIAPRHTTLPLLDLVGSDDLTHFDRPGGHIGLMAGSKARKEIWPDLTGWLAERSD